MNIKISNNVTKPIYEQIATQIKTMVMSGELKAGDGIPSMRELAKTLRVSVITVQKAYEDLHREGFIETAVGRGSFIAAYDREFYKKEQRRRAEEHLMSAAELGRMSNIPLSELTDQLTLFYQQGERRIYMRKFLLKKELSGDDYVYIIAVAISGDMQYRMAKKKESMLTETYAVKDQAGGDVAEVRREHVLFTPAKLPKVTVSMKDGKSFTVKKEMEQLTDVIRVEGASMAVRGTVFSDHFDLLSEDKCIAAFAFTEKEMSFEANENEELTAALFAFAVTLAR